MRNPVENAFVRSRKASHQEQQRSRFADFWIDTMRATEERGGNIRSIYWEPVDISGLFQKLRQIVIMPGSVSIGMIGWSNRGRSENSGPIDEILKYSLMVLGSNDSVMPFHTELGGVTREGNHNELWSLSSCGPVRTFQDLSDLVVLTNTILEVNSLSTFKEDVTEMPNPIVI